MTYRARQRFLLAAIGVLALGILGSIAWLIWYDFSRGRTAPKVGEPEPFSEFAARNVEADIQRVHGIIAPGGLVDLYLARFQRRAGRYPARLEDLLVKPPDLEPAQWDGPYVGTPEVLNDPWGRPYRYRQPGVRNEKRYDLWSLGPDGVDGTGDDIGNW